MYVVFTMPKEQFQKVGRQLIFVFGFGRKRNFIFSCIFVYDRKGEFCPGL